MSGSRHPGAIRVAPSTTLPQPLVTLRWWLQVAVATPLRRPRPTRPESIRLSASWLIRRRMATVVIVGALVALVLFLLSVGTSDYPLSALDVGRILLGGGRRVENVVVFDTMLPRALVALLVGFGLGMCGALTQLIARNPLATPDILGITAGASVAAVAAIAFPTGLGATLTGLGVPASALIGALVTAVVMYVLAWPGRRANAGIDPFRLVLIGVGMTWMLQAATGYLLTRAAIADVARAQVWLVGSVSGASWSDVGPLAWGLGVGVVIVVVLTRQIDALSLGPDIARGLGVRTTAVSTTVLLVAVVVAALAVSAAGPIGFVGLLAPQIARRLAGTAVPTPLISGLLGAVLVLGADLLCRRGLPDLLPADLVASGHWPVLSAMIAAAGGVPLALAVAVARFVVDISGMLDGLPVGIVTAALGGPFLIYLMVTMSRRATV